MVCRELKRLKRSGSLRLPLTSSQACVSTHQVMDLKQLRYFTLVANTGSIARASAHLGIAAPAISRSIAALETELNCRLFDRDGRGMRLTKTGERLNDRAGGILREVELTRQEIAADGHHLTGEIVIGATPAVMALIGQALIERVQGIDNNSTLIASETNAIRFNAFGHTTNIGSPFSIEYNNAANKPELRRIVCTYRQGRIRIKNTGC